MLLIFFLVWVVFQMRLTLEVTLIGLAVSLAVYWFCRRHMGYSLEIDRTILRKLGRGLTFVAVLVWETVKSNLEVSRFVFAREIQVEPQIIFFRTELKTEAARVALANSITLTPGTITVSLNDDRFCVHCLNHHMGEGIEDSALVRRLKALEED